jgi:hypothetical protein
MVPKTVERAWKDNWSIEDLEELFVSQMLTIDIMFSELLSDVGLCENE